MKTIGYTLAILASSVLASACTDDATPTNQPPEGSTSGGEDTTFDHDNGDYISPWDLLDRLQKEGPPRYTSRVHSCSKVRYKTLGTLLGQVGMNMANTTALSANDLYKTGFNALGGPNYANRIRENISITTSGALCEFDIFAAGAQEVIDAFASTTSTIATRCPGATLFDTSNACQPAGIACITGVPTNDAHMSSWIAYCNLTVQTASDATVGKRLAVAEMLSAAYTCE